MVRVALDRMTTRISSVLVFRRYERLIQIAQLGRRVVIILNNGVFESSPGSLIHYFTFYPL